MMEKKTDELMKVLENQPNADSFLKSNHEELLKLTLPELLQAFLKEKKTSRAEAIRRADLDRTYGYQIFDGRHTPSRDKLIRLAFGLRLTVDETQTLLKTARFAPLYPRIKRDVFLLECLFQGGDLIRCNEILEDHGLPPLE